MNQRWDVNPQRGTKEEKMKKYKYNQYTLRLNDALNNFVKQEAKARGLSELNYIRFMIVKTMEQKEDVQKTL